MKRKLKKVLVLLVIMLMVFSAVAVISNAEELKGKVYVAETDISAGGYWNVDGMTKEYRSILVEATAEDYDIHYDPDLELLVLNNATIYGSGSGASSGIHSKYVDLTVKYIGDCSIEEYYSLPEGYVKPIKGTLDMGIWVEWGTLTIDSDRKSTLTVQADWGSPIIRVDYGLIIEKYADVVLERTLISGGMNEKAIEVLYSNQNYRVEIYDNAKLTIDSRPNTSIENKSSAIYGNTTVYADAQLITNNRLAGSLTVNGGSAIIKAAVNPAETDKGYTPGVSGSVTVKSGSAEIDSIVGGSINVTGGELTVYSLPKGEVTLGEGINALYGTREYLSQYYPMVKYCADEGIKVNIDYNKASAEIAPTPCEEGFVRAIPGTDLVFQVTSNIGTYRLVNTDTGYGLITSTSTDGTQKFYLENITQETNLRLQIKPEKPTELCVGNVQIDTATGEAKLGKNLPQGVSYNPDTNTLTLNNAEIDAGHTVCADNKSIDHYVGIYSNKDLFIELIGENKINLPGLLAQEGYAIQAEQNIIITGGGSLDIQFSLCGAENVAVKAGKAACIENVSVDIVMKRTAGSNKAIAIDCPIGIYRSTVNITAADGKYSIGINTNGWCNISESFVNISSGEAWDKYTFSRAIANISGGGDTLIINGNVCTYPGTYLQVTPDDYTYSPSQILIGNNILFRCAYDINGNRAYPVFNTYEYCTLEDGVLVPCNEDDDWTVNYDFRTNTLRLRNFNVVTGSANSIFADGTLNIELMNTNEIIGVGSGEHCAISACDSINFSGTGSLLIRSRNDYGRAICVYGTNYLTANDKTAFGGSLAFPNNSKYGGSANVDYNSSYLYYDAASVEDYRFFKIQGSDAAYEKDYGTVLITFDYGYNNIKETQYTYSTGKLPSLPNPTRSGYYFVGWYKTASGDFEVTTETKFSAKTTVYAKWVKKTLDFVIVFDPNGGTVDPLSDKTNDYGYLYSLPVPVREGHTFIGWFTNAQDGEEITSETKFTGEATVYAHWALGVNISFDANGGFTDVSTVKTDDDGYIKDLPVAIRDGYTFIGWYTQPQGGSKLTFETKYLFETTAYAQWKKGVTVTFDPNGGTVDRIYDTTNEYDYLYSLPMPEREGYKFDGWFTAPEGGEIITSETKFKTATTVYAHWTKLPDEPTTDEPSTGEDPTEPNTTPDDTPNDSWLIRFFKAIQNFFTKIITWLQALFGFRIK